MRRSFSASQPRWLELGHVLGAVLSLVLNCPQGTQGGDLGLGQSSDARDIQSLVGAVAAQSAQMLATLEVPEPDRPVIAATGQPAPIGTHLECLHPPVMRFSLPHA